MTISEEEVLKAMLKICSSYSGECPCLRCVKTCSDRCVDQEDAEKYGYDVDTSLLCSMARVYCEGYHGGSTTNDAR